MALKEYLFCTGVKACDPNGIKGIVSPNGVMMIPFYCEGVPDGAIFKCASNSILENGLFRAEIVKGGLLSKYAYFQLTEAK